ncbi:MmpS family transport accessory protein [Mycolicibacterium palauense]|uniref:MmpS family transport accessory protein n=1 Tax=Mycolicibacterium palauense TaxID=2034511 RepID=UPI000BFEC922|nr:MmpS family transport accessory protein [Mycolicibacterium palauense]
MTVFISVLKRAWVPVLVVAAVTVGAFTVAHLRSVFGSNGAIVTPIGTDTAENFNPKVVTYEVFGTGSTAIINYTDLDGLPQRTGEVNLPWSLTLETTIPSVMPNLVAQGDGQSIGCRVTVDDEVKDERTAHGVDPATYCLVKAA